MPSTYSVQFSCSVMSNSLQPHGLQHSRPPCPPTPGACSNSCLSSQWCHPTISSSFISFSSCPQSFPASGSFPVSQFFTSGGQSIGVSASALDFLMKYSGLISFKGLWLTGLISLLSKTRSRVFSNTTVQKHQFFGCSAFSMIQLSHRYMTTGKTIALTRRVFVGKVMSLLFNILSRFVIVFLPGSKRLLISWLQSPSAVILEPNKIKSLTVSIVSPSVGLEVMGPDAMILVFWMLSFKPVFPSTRNSFLVQATLVHTAQFLGLQIGTVAARNSGSPCSHFCPLLESTEVPQEILL